MNCFAVVVDVTLLSRVSRQQGEDCRGCKRIWSVSWQQTVHHQVQLGRQLNIALVTDSVHALWRLPLKGRTDGDHTTEGDPTTHAPHAIAMSGRVQRRLPSATLASHSLRNYDLAWLSDAVKPKNQVYCVIASYRTTELADKCLSPMDNVPSVPTSCWSSGIVSLVKRSCFNGEMPTTIASTLWRFCSSSN